MKCPVCATDTLNPLEHDGVELDFCHTCKGVWFDQGEAAFYLETTTDMPALNEVLASAVASSRSCPRCERAMVEVDYMPGEALKLDVCVGCKGIFLDGGELPRIEALATRLEPHGKVQRTMRALEGMGYQVLGGKTRRS